MILDGVLGNIQARRDFLVRKTLRHQANQLLLPEREIGSLYRRSRSFKRNPVTPPRTASKKCSGLLLMAIRRNLGAEQLLALLRTFTGNHRTSRKSKTTTSHCVSTLFPAKNPHFRGFRPPGNPRVCEKFDRVTHVTNDSQ